MSDKPINLIDEQPSAAYWTSKEALGNCIEYVAEHPEFTQAVLMVKDPVSGKMHTAVARVRCTEGMGMCMRASNGFQLEIESGEDDEDGGADAA